MLGNDVVDLGDAETRWVHPRFDARVFDADERQRIAESDDPRRMRWMLWAAKESAYKATRRRGPTVFSPARFRVELSSEREGCVWHEGVRRSLRIETYGGCIHALVTETRDDGAVVRRVARLDRGEPSQRVRDLAIETVSHRLGEASGRLRVESAGRIPELVAGDRRLPLSIAHHGRFVGFACRLDGGGAR